MIDKDYWIISNLKVIHCSQLLPCCPLVRAWDSATCINYFLTTKTGMLAWWTTYWLTLPINVLLMMPRPRVPVMIMSTLFSSLAFTIASPGLDPANRSTLPFNCWVHENLVICFSHHNIIQYNSPLPPPNVYNTCTVTKMCLYLK